jgi:methionine-rich copper-binding protein CopC
MRHTKSIGTFTLLAVIVLGGPTLAHPRLESASPSPDVSISASPSEIKLNFSEGIIPKFSGLELKDEAGQLIKTGETVTDPKDSKQLVTPLSKPLAAGRYTVSWHAVSEDTHRVNGDYTFRVTAENTPAKVKTEGARSDDPVSGDGRIKKNDDDCRSQERGDRVRGRSADWDRHDQNVGDRDRDSYRRSTRPPECIIDDDGYKYCRVR